MQEPMTQAIANGISWLLAVLGIGEAANVFNLLITIIAVVWFIKALSGSRKRRKRKKSDDWLYRAQQHQQDMYSYSDPVKARPIEQPRRTRPQKPSKSVTVSPTGWILDEETGEWTPPESLRREANTRWKWDEKKRIWIDLSKK